LSVEEVDTATVTQTPHLVELDRPYTKGAHVAEFELMSSSQPTGLYGASCWVILSPSEKVVSGEVAVTRLAIRERLVIALPIQMGPELDASQCWAYNEENGRD